MLLNSTCNNEILFTSQYLRWVVLRAPMLRCKLQQYVARITRVKIAQAITGILPQQPCNNTVNMIAKKTTFMFQHIAYVRTWKTRLDTTAKFMIVVTSLFNLVISSFHVTTCSIVYEQRCWFYDLSWWFQQRCSSLFVRQAMNSLFQHAWTSLSTTMFKLASSTMFKLASSTMFKPVSSTMFKLGSSTMFKLASSTMFKPVNRQQQAVCLYVNLVPRLVGERRVKSLGTKLSLRVYFTYTIINIKAVFQWCVFFTYVHVPSAQNT